MTGTAAPGLSGVDDVARLLLGHAERRRLRGVLAAMLTDPAALGRCRLRRAKLKPGRKLTAYFDVDLRGYVGARPVVVTWLHKNLATVNGSDTVSSLQAEAEARDRGLAAPFDRLAGRFDGGLRISVAPLDEQFPQLPRMWDPEHLADVLGAEGGSRWTVSPIRYRPGQRHVLRYDLRDPATGASRMRLFAKVQRPAEPSPLAGVQRHVSGIAAFGGALRALEPFAYLADDCTLLTRGLDGTPLSVRLASGVGALREELRRAGHLLAAFHAAPPPPSLASRTLVEELVATARAAEHITALRPATGARLLEALDIAGERADRLPADRPVLAHGDFKADHLWATRDRLTVMDLDRVCIADPALDRGKFLADLRFRHVSAPRFDLDEARDAFLTGCGAEVDAAEPTSIYEAVWLIKLAARRVPLFDPLWGARCDRLVELAAGLLGVQGRRAVPAGTG